MTEIQKEIQEKWESATFTNNFLFCKILSSDLDLCRELLELLLGIGIERLELAQSEMAVKADIGSHGVRFDVYARDDGRIFDVELQSAETDDLAKRARYYQGVIDVDNLPEGVFYSELKDSYIIFICLFDLFGRGLPVYTFENICIEDSTVKLNDRAIKVFFNTRACDRISDGNLKAFLKYLTGARADTDLTRRIEAKVARAKGNQDWRKNFMTWEQSIRYEGVRAGKERARENAGNFLKMNVLSPEQIAQGCSLPLEEVLALKERLASDSEGADS